MDDEPHNLFSHPRISELSTTAKRVDAAAQSLDNFRRAYGEVASGDVRLAPGSTFEDCTSRVNLDVGIRNVPASQRYWVGGTIRSTNRGTRYSHIDNGPADVRVPEPDRARRSLCGSVIYRAEVQHDTVPATCRACQALS